MERVFEWREGDADDLQSMLVRARDELFIASDYVLRRWSRFSLGHEDGVRPADVVDPHHQGDGVDMRLAQDVPVEAGEGIVTHAIAKYARARNALVDDGDIGAALGEPLG